MRHRAGESAVPFGLRTDTKSWYAQFWPWFVVALPLTSVVFSVATLVVATRNADSLVRDDWYDAGVTINRDFDREKAAAALGLSARLGVSADGVLEVELDGRDAVTADELELALSYPADAARDRTVHLVAVCSGRYVGREPLRDPDGRWDAALVPAGAAWRLAGRVALARGAVATLAAN